LGGNALASVVQQHEQQHEQRKTWPAIVYYSFCSSTLLIVNKLALHVLPAPVILLSIQLWFAVAAVYLLAFFRVVSVQPLRCSTALHFAPVAGSFLGTLFANAKVLQYANVETFITFRSSTPLVLCLCDYFFLGRQLPSPRSALCLLGLLLSSAGYGILDHGFSVRAYGWLGVWYLSFTTYEVVVKRLCDTVALDNWTRVVYTNALAGGVLAAFMPLALSQHQSGASFSTTALLAWNNGAVVLASCLIGIGVSHSAYVMRSACSATLSAVVGIVCKALTVVINIAIWDKHATPAELAFLVIGLISGALYEQAPMRATAATTNVLGKSPDVALVATAGAVMVNEAAERVGRGAEDNEEAEEHRVLLKR
jgi:solute carrier family 35